MATKRSGSRKPDRDEPDEATAGKAAEGDTNLRKWVGAGIGAGIGSAAIAAALLYANRARKGGADER